MEMPNRTLQILLVEDDDIDAELVQRAFHNKRIANPIYVVKDGIQALQKLRGEGGHEALKRPFLILLDLNMPRMNGIEFLQELRADASLHDNVVFILSTSDDDRDKLAAYEQHIAGYLVKSKVEDDFINLVNVIDHYWRYIELPPERE